VSESNVVVVGAAGPWRDAVSAEVGGVAVEHLTEDAARADVVVVLAHDGAATMPASGAERWADLATSIAGAAEQSRLAHAGFAGAAGRLVIVGGDPEHGSPPDRSRAAALRSLATSLAAEWGPSTAVVAVTTAPTSSATDVAAACRFASSAPSGTVVALGST